MQTMMILLSMTAFSLSTGMTKINEQHPLISVWTNGDDLVRRGQRVRVFFETSDDAYVTVFRIDTDGRVSVLFPLGPWDHGFARGGRRYEVRPFSGRYAFTATDDPGEGYVFATSSAEPFAYGGLSAGARWYYRGVGINGRVVGDPYVAVMELIDQIAPVHPQFPSYDVTPYYVDQRVAFPRFVCYDCHAYARYPDWNPYHDPCHSFRLIVYDDPHYYPARVRDGSRVVFARGPRLEPRYVFQQRIASKPAVEVRDRRPVNVSDRRRVTDRGENSRRFGGVGRVPAPRGRRAAPHGGDGTGGDGGRVAVPPRGPHTPSRATVPGRRVGPPTRSSRVGGSDPRVTPRRATRSSTTRRPRARPEGRAVRSRPDSTAAARRPRPAPRRRRPPA